MKLKFGLFMALLLSAHIASASGIANSASLFLRDEPGNYIGGNLPAEGQIFQPSGTATFKTYLSGPYETTFYSGGNENFNLIFTAPQYSADDNLVKRRPLTVGFYDNARRVISTPEMNPGMDVSGFGRGYNRLSGWFDIKEVEYASSGEIVKLAVDFAEYGENLTKSGPALFGSFRFNSDIPLTTALPEPSSLVLSLLSLSGVALAIRRTQHGTSPRTE